MIQAAQDFRHDLPEARRVRIVNEAVRVIGQRGCYGFTIQELAQRCQLSNAGLLYHFKSREQILLAVLKDIEVREAAFIRPLVAATKRAAVGEATRSAVLDLLHAMVARASSQPQLMRLFAVLQAESIDHDHPAHAWSRRRDAVVLAFFARLVAPYVNDPPSTARMLVAIMDGLTQHWLRMDRSFDVVAEWDRVVAIQLGPASVPPPVKPRRRQRKPQSKSVP